MRKFTLAQAAIAAALAFTLAPAAAQAPVAPPSVITLVSNAVIADSASTLDVLALDDAQFTGIDYPRVAPGQERADVE